MAANLWAIVCAVRGFAALCQWQAFEECFTFSCDLNLVCVFPITLGSLSKHDVDGRENVNWKCNFAFLQSCFNFDSWLWNGFLERALRVKLNNIIAIFFLFFFLQDFIQLYDSRIRDSCEIGFRVQINAEFPRQVMNFPIKLWIFRLQLVPGGFWSPLRCSGSRVGLHA